MVLKSKSVLSGSKQMVRSRSSDNLPTSQSQVNVQMMSHTLTIREVSETNVIAKFAIPLVILLGCGFPTLTLKDDRLGSSFEH